MPLLTNLAAVIAFLLVGISGGFADVTFTLNNVQLYSNYVDGTPDGTLTGSFVTNDSRTTLISADITAYAAGDFPGLTYTVGSSGNATVTDAQLPGYFRLDVGTSDELQLYFPTGLANGASVVSPLALSYEHENAGGNRYAEAGTVSVGVPEPSSAALLAMLAAVAIPAALAHKGRGRI